MASPLNFQVVEQQILTISSGAANTVIQFKSANAAGAPDLWIKNIGNDTIKASPFQLLLGVTSPTAVVDAAADGTMQIKIAAGESCLIKKGATTFVAGITEGTDETVAYLFIGYGE